MVDGTVRRERSVCVGDGFGGDEGVEDDDGAGGRGCGGEAIRDEDGSVAMA